MIWDQFRDLLFYLNLAGCVVTSSSLTQEVAGSNNLLYEKFSLNSVKFNENI